MESDTLIHINFLPSFFYIDIEKCDHDKKDGIKKSMMETTTKIGVKRDVICITCCRTWEEWTNVVQRRQFEDNYRINVIIFILFDNLTVRK